MKKPVSFRETYPDIEIAKCIVLTTIHEYGRLDILVNNAGMVIPGWVDNTDIVDWQRTMDVNVEGVFLISKFAISELIKSRGCIINNASGCATKGVIDRAAYSASKGAVLALTRSMAIGLYRRWY